MHSIALLWAVSVEMPCFFNPDLQHRSIYGFLALAYSCGHRGVQRGLSPGIRFGW